MLHTSPAHQARPEAVRIHHSHAGSMARVAPSLIGLPPSVRPPQRRGPRFAPSGMASRRSVSATASVNPVAEDLGSGNVLGAPLLDWAQMAGKVAPLSLGPIADNTTEEEERLESGGGRRASTRPLSSGRMDRSSSVSQGLGSTITQPSLGSSLRLQGAAPRRASNTDELFENALANGYFIL
jgi:hypothetical protein